MHLEEDAGCSEEADAFAEMLGFWSHDTLQ